MKKGCWQPQLPSIRHPLEGPGRMIKVQNSKYPTTSSIYYLPSSVILRKFQLRKPHMPKWNMGKGLSHKTKTRQKKGWMMVVMIVVTWVWLCRKNCWTMSKMINLNDSSKERWNLKWILHLNETLIFWKKKMQFSWGSARSYRILMWKR